MTARWAHQEPGGYYRKQTKQAADSRPYYATTTQKNRALAGP